MQTRRQADLHTVSIRELSSQLATRRPAQQTRVRRRDAIAAKIQQRQMQEEVEQTEEQVRKGASTKVAASITIERIPAPVPDAKDLLIDKYQGIIHEQSCLIVEQRNMVQIMHEREQQHHHSNNDNSKKRFMLIDTESFRFDNNELLPLQIACGVYEWNEADLRLDNIGNYTVYIEQIYYNQHFRDAIPAGCLKKHDENIAANSYLVSDANHIIQNMIDLIEIHQVSTLVGYNISWDFLAIANLGATFCKDIEGFDHRCDNPFNRMRLDYLDLMHEIVKKYGRELTSQGIHDGTVHRAEDSNRIVLRRNTKFSKSIYSAEYVLQHFFGVSQHHMANTDVADEALMLEKCLLEFGLSSLEYNVAYPQMNCYQRMLHYANELFVDPIDVDADEQEEEDSLEEGEYRPRPTKRRLVKAAAPSSPEAVVCLFDQEDDKE